MTDDAKILITANALPTLKESIHIGTEVLRRKHTAYQHKLRRFESANSMDTAVFTELFEKGELGDKKEWLEWEHAVSVENLLRRKLGELDAVRYEP